jgi:hypothetical protein
MIKHLVPGLLAALALANSAAAEVQNVKHRITGLFSREREADLREAVKQLGEVAIVAIDFDTAEVTFSYDAAKLFPKVKEKDLVEKFDNLLRTNSKHTFGAKPLTTTPKDKLTRVEIAVLGNDCKGCDLSLYEIVYRIDGVEQATASFKTGLLTALIDPARTNRDALVDALKKRQVNLKAP